MIRIQYFSYTRLFYYPNSQQSNKRSRQKMCGNDMSVVVVPNNNTFIEQLRTQIATGSISIKNNPYGTKQQITSNQIAMINRFDTTKLKSIELIRCDITHELLEDFLKMDFSNLKILSLNHNKIGPIGCRMIASCDSLANLKELELSDNKIRDVGLKALASSTFQNLQDLVLNDNGLTVQGIKSLKTFSSIQCLSLSGNSLNDESVDPIKSINPNGILFLALSRNSMTNQALRSFLPVKRLQVLLMDRNKITTSKSELQARKQLFVFY